LIYIKTYFTHDSVIVNERICRKCVWVKLQRILYIITKQWNNACIVVLHLEVSYTIWKYLTCVKQVFKAFKWFLINSKASSSSMPSPMWSVFLTMNIYECDTGFHLLGDNVITCINGSWSSPSLICNGEYMTAYNIINYNFEIKFKQWWPTISPISTKRTITSHLKLLNTKKTYDDEKNMVKVKTGYWDHHHKVNWLLGSPPQGKLVTGITTTR